MAEGKDVGKDVGDLVRQATHTATVVPRLWSAALRSGAGPRGAVEVLRISEAALRTAAAHAGGVPGRTNAVRHFLWQAVLTARLGRKTAAEIALSQETGTTRYSDSLVDHHNNVVGQTYGAAHADELRKGPVSAAVEGLVPVALQKWDEGELVWVKPRRRRR
jgi:hypothetical protein